MITRTLHGVPFRAISPSFYVLASHPEVDISFLGDQWLLHCPGSDGEDLLKWFPSLSAAAAMIAEAMTLTA